MKLQERLILRDSKKRFTTLSRAKYFQIKIGKRVILSGEFLKTNLKAATKQNLILDLYLEKLSKTKPSPPKPTTKDLKRPTKFTAAQSLQLMLKWGVDYYFQKNKQGQILVDKKRIPKLLENYKFIGVQLYEHYLKAYLKRHVPTPRDKIKYDAIYFDFTLKIPIMVSHLNRHKKVVFLKKIFNFQLKNFLKHVKGERLVSVRLKYTRIMNGQIETKAIGTVRSKLTVSKMHQSFEGLVLEELWEKWNVDIPKYLQEIESKGIYVQGFILENIERFET